MRYASNVVDRLAFQGGESWESAISVLLKSHRRSDALAAYRKMPKDASAWLSGRTFVLLLKACVHIHDSDCGAEIHEHVATLGLLETDLHVSSSLIHMYVRCGMLVQAEQVLEGLPVRNVVSWTILIGGYIDEGHYEKALQCFRQMLSGGVTPSSRTFVYCVRACCALNDSNQGDEIHVEIARYGLHENPFVGTTLVSMYAKFGYLHESWQVFEKLEVRNVISWTAMIAGYVEHGNGEEALMCSDHMLLEGVSPNAVTHICSLKACVCAGNVDKGQELHAHIEKQGLLGLNHMICVTLVNMYAKCGWLARAQLVFDDCVNKSVSLWNALITGYVEHGDGGKALFYFDQMQFEGILPDSVTLICCLKACSSIKAVARGQELHFEAERQGLVKKDLRIAIILVYMYAKCGLYTMAHHLFDILPHKSIVAWNALLAGYAAHGFGEKVLELFTHMQQEEVCPDAVSYLCVLKACSNREDAFNGVDLVNNLLRNGPQEGDIIVRSTLVSVYGKQGDLIKSQELFDELPDRDAIAWNALAAGYAEHGFGEEALKCLEQMLSEGFLPNAVTYLCSLKACSSMGAVDKGRDIHCEIERQGLSNEELIGSTLVDMYGKCGLPATAHHVFDNLQVQNVAAWTALMGGYGQCGKSNMVFKMYDKMVGTGLKPNPVTLVVVLSACNRSYLLGKSQSYFESMSKNFGVVHTIKHHACLVDLFSRQGQLDEAMSVVHKMPFHPNHVIWRIMLDACKGSGSMFVGMNAFGHVLQSKDNFCSS